MHKHFADWYREVDLDVVSETLQARWEGVETIVKNLDNVSSLELVRLLFGRTPIDNGFVDGLRVKFAEHDGTFPMRSNDREMAVLAGASLAHCLSSEGQLGDVAALAILTQAFLPYDDVPPQRDIVTVAEQYLNRRSLSLRSHKRLSPNKPKTLAVEKTVAEIYKQCEDDTDVSSSTLGKALIPPLIQTSKAVARIDKALNVMQEETSHALNVLSEECNILWWVLGGYSQELEATVASLDLGTAAVVAGKELADLIHVTPGPVSAVALLDKMLHSGRKEIPDSLSVGKAINEIPRAWRKRVAEDSDLNQTQTVCPLHLAIKTSLTTEGVQEWGPAYKMATGIELDHRATPLDISLQFYRECLLIRLLT